MNVHGFWEMGRQNTQMSYSLFIHFPQYRFLSSTNNIIASSKLNNFTKFEEYKLLVYKLINL